MITHNHYDILPTINNNNLSSRQLINPVVVNNDSNDEQQQQQPSTRTRTTTATTAATTAATTGAGVGMTAIIGTAAAVGGAAIVTKGLLMPDETVAKIIDKASNLVGVDKALMYAMAKQESGFNPNAAAKTSSATGLYQFIKGTWKSMVDKYGSKFPILKERGPLDAEANAIAGALFIKENADFLAKSKIPVNATTIYAAHFLGPGGAKTLLTAQPNENASLILPQAAQANKPIFYDKNNNPRTVQQVIDVLFQKVGQYQEKYSAALNSPNNSGDKIYQASNDLKNNKADINDSNDKSVASVNSTNINTQKSQSSPIQVAGNDRPAYLNKAQGNAIQRS